MMNKILPLMLCALIMFSSCGSSAISSTLIEMEMTDNYDTQDPFVCEKLFYVDDSIDTVKLDISFQMQGESGILEIADNETKQVFWSEAWSGDVDNTSFTISLNAIEKEKEYVIKFTGTKIKHAKILVASKDNLIKERDKPIKPDKN